MSATDDGANNDGVTMRSTSPTLLLVDDDTLLMRVMLRSLRHAGIDAHGAETSSEAFAFAQERTVDILVADYFLEGEMGLGLVDKLSRGRSDLTRFLITGSLLPEVAHRAVETGRVDAYLRKPFDLETLVASICRAGDYDLDPSLMSAPRRRGRREPLLTDDEREALFEATRAVVPAAAPGLRRQILDG